MKPLGNAILLELGRQPQTIDALVSILGVERASVAGSINALHGYGRVRSINGKKPNVWEAVEPVTDTQEPLVFGAEAPAKPPTLLVVRRMPVVEQRRGLVRASLAEPQQRCGDCGQRVRTRRRFGGAVACRCGKTKGAQPTAG